MKSIKLNIPLLALTVCTIGLLLGGALYRVDIDTDIIPYLPQNDAVLSDAGQVFKHHPIQGEMAIDLGLPAADADRLVQCSQLVEQRLRQSGLFSRVGTQQIQDLVPTLIGHIVANLPVLFTRQELDQQVLPLLAPEKIQRQLETLQSQLLNLDAIGQAGHITQDPLGLRNLIMAKLSHIAPSGKIEVYKGKLLSPDRKHLLIVATPVRSGTDTAYARKISRLMETISMALADQYGGANPVTLTPMGAYRAALDNERIARHDVKKAIGLATMGIALLLMLAFPRPLIGLFAFLPAVAGTVAAFFVLALWHKTVSILALGFGGAIISITVDHGIAYLLFLDRSRTSYGKEASTEIWAIGLMAALTTIGAFGALCLTGFPVFEQLGQFTAMGIAFSFLFVHSVFPKIFPELPPASVRKLPLRSIVAKLPVSTKPIALVAFGFAIVMAFFARPQFNVSLSAMNTVSRQTSASEQLMTRVWGGGIFNKIYLMTEAESPVDLRRAGDRLLAQVHRDMRSGEIESAFLPAMIFPGQELRKQNLADWQAFWDPQRKDRTLDALASASALGFTTDAFRPFARILSASKQPEEYRPIPEPFFALMGITRGSNGTWMQFATLTPGPNYDARQFHQHYAAGVRILDPTFFSQRLGQLLFSTFMKMLIIIGISVTLLLFFFFLDLKLTFIALAPVLFALVCTLGTLNLIGHALDIPALMLAIIAMGMGIDYALFLVRARQRYGGMRQPGFGRIKLAVIMAAVSTLIGFGVLCVAEHALLRSAGITSFLGIGYALIGAFFLLPPLLDHWFRKEKEKGGLSGHWRRRVMNRYRTLETYPRLFARFKMKNDVMFSELPRLLNGCGNMRTVLDIGTGYGVPGCCILEHCARAKIYGIDPDRERIRVAALAFGHRGTVTCAAAPDIPPAPEAADAAFLLDIIHFLDDSALNLTLARLRKALHSNAALIIRAVIPPPDGNYSRLWKLDALRMKLTGVQAHHRTTDAIRAMVEGAGFQIRQIEQSGNNIESTWFIATPKPEDGTGISA